MSRGAVIPRVSVTLLAAPVLDCGSDVPYAHLERQRVLLVHAAQLVHERGHVPHGTVRQAPHAHEFPAASLREAGLAALVGASRRAGQLDGVLRLAAPTPVAAALLRLTGLDWRFEIFATVPDAISAPVHRGAGEADAPKPRACCSAQPPIGEFRARTAAEGHVRR